MLPTLESTSKLLGEYLNSGLAAALPEVPVLNDNDGQQRPATDRPFIRIAYRPAGDVQAALGNGLWREEGLIMAQVFTPKGTGDLQANRIADIIKGLLRGRDIGGVQFFGVSVVTVGERESFFQLNLNAPYYRQGA